VRVLEVATVAELEAALGPRTAMVYILAGPRADESPISLKPSRRWLGAGCRSRRRGGRDPDRPNVHCRTAPRSSATAAASACAGRRARAAARPQESGRAAWVHSAPHHGFARAMKVGKEEAIGMLMAVEMW
jgi:L-seryl-tRNA(Ser) seleniumtransferase